MYYPLSINLTIPSKHYKYILQILNNGEEEQARLVGGCVRDALLNQFTLDIDIATTLLPEQVIILLNQHNIKAVPTGVKFGTISAFIEDEIFEITTLREDINPSGRHTDVIFTKDFKIDASRRDFTINALSYCPFKEELYDYFNGYEDLLSLKVKFIGIAAERIQEDYLRILRFFRFSCKYSQELDKEGLNTCIMLKEGLTILSKERIVIEMDKLLQLEKSPQILMIMFEKNILQIILPINNFNHLWLNNIFNFTMNFPEMISSDNYLTARYAVLLYSNYIENINLVSFRFARKKSNEIKDIIEFIKSFNFIEQDYLLNKIWLEKDNYLNYLIALFAVGGVDKVRIVNFINIKKFIPKPKFIISGHDLNKIGFSGIKLGKIIDKLKNKWISSNFMLNKQQLMNLITDDE